jgi:hypothetical protein
MDTSSKFDDKSLRKPQEKGEELEGERQVALPELLTDDFIRQHTNYQTLQEMIDASGIEGIEEIRDGRLSKFIATHSQFSSWEEMLKVAIAGYYKRQLGL